MINASLNSKMKSWRHALHQIPEFGFETFDTAAFIVKKLNEFGIEDIVRSALVKEYIEARMRYEDNYGVSA